MITLEQQTYKKAEIFSKDFEVMYQEAYNKGNLYRADLILERKKIDTRNINTKSSSCISRKYNIEPREAIQSKFKFIKLGLKQKNTKIFKDMADEAYLSANNGDLKELIYMSYSGIPQEENNIVKENETGIAEFGSQILSSNSLSLNEKKKFIRKIHALNPKFSKDIISIYNINNMMKTMNKEQEVDFIEILSFFEKFSKIGLPNERASNFTNKLPLRNNNIDYSPLLGKSLKKVPEHRKALEVFGGDVEKYKKYLRKNNEFSKTVSNGEKFDANKMLKLKVDKVSQPSRDIILMKTLMDYNITK